MVQNTDIITDDYADAYQSLGKRFAEIVFGGPYRRFESIEGISALCDALDLDWQIFHDEDVAAPLRGRVRDALMTES